MTKKRSGRFFPEHCVYTISS